MSQGPRKFAWKGGESWISGGELFFSYGKESKETHSFDISSLGIREKDILAYEPRDKENGILITKRRVLVLVGASDVYFASVGNEPKSPGFEKDVASMRAEYGDFITAKISSKDIYILTENGVFMENKLMEEGWLCTPLLKIEGAKIRDCGMMVEGDEIMVRIGPYAFAKKKGGAFQEACP